ncbi:MAG: FliA/WhiG family RNA polymerase sigma factor [Candidatus Tectomicrobia bacterium]|uniref:FliA/WhiG family RNA polymerase sigma factor n=1 Tax=Tectimicrobiota bacterium TaxID=2528274 RepID=A0A932CL30_UNCTE|nr:FliA/WhiG family RNA polymerase sigma factor [Candidatus Tectomicrobia bacterium]
MEGVLKAGVREWNGRGTRKVSPEAREGFILKYAPLIKFIAHRIAVRLPSHIEVNDLINAGIIGLMDAVEKFDPAREIQFKTYAEFRIRGAILDELRSRDWVPRSVRRKSNLLADTYARLERELGRPAEDEEIARALRISLEEFRTILNQVNGVSLISLDELLAAPDGENGRPLWETLSDLSEDDPSWKVNLHEVKCFLAKAIDELTPKERMVISLYYYEELTMKEIGEVLQVTESRVSQLHAKAILRLRGKIRRWMGEDSLGLERN